MLSTVMLVVAATVALSQDAPNRSELTVPDGAWSAIDERLGLDDGRLGYTPEQLEPFGRDLHVLRPVLRQFADVRKTLRFSGRSTDLLLDNAAYEDEFIRHAFAQFLDENVGRRIRLPGLDAQGISGELPDSFDASTQTGGWNVPWLEDKDTKTALEFVFDVGADGFPSALLELTEAEQRLIIRLLVAVFESSRYTTNAFDRASIDLGIDAAREQYGLDTGYVVSIAPRFEPYGRLIARSLMDVVGTTDLGYLGHGSILAAKSVRLAVEEFNRAQPDGATFTGIIRIGTTAGPIVIGGVDSDNHVHVGYPGPALVIDFGGDDRYEGSFAVSDGVRERPVSLLIDLGGRDTYLPGEPEVWQPRNPSDAESEDRSNPTLAAGVFGLGMLWDLGGENDAYEAVESSMGVGLHGVGMLIDDGGDDTYLVRQSWGQGVGHVGFGAIIDRGGNDQYTSGRSSQAHGSTRGAGVIVDLAGNDTYTIPDSTARSELYLGRVVAMGQGCGYGRRADLGDSRSMAGGFGVLVDGAGDDHYSAMAWSQGAGYWWGVGILEDRGGNDTYRQGKYSQGAAAHFAVGIHIDLDGNDTYNANPERMANPYTGEEQWIAENQYAGHARDGALGIFVDGAGNDEYVLRANCAGNGDLNSVGFFWDRSGDD
ncbi:MAG: hypothetical protein HRU13_06890, partial [Phycisphaerales bacterium]|nr:hypothetical protein [Phycisphaerales bacterium]